MLFVVGAVLSLIATVGRWRFESGLRDVQLTVDYEDTRALADAYQIPHLTLLKELRDRGVRSVGVYNTTLTNLVGTGRLTLISRDEAELVFPKIDWARIPVGYRYLVMAPPQNGVLFEQVKQHLIEQQQPTLKVRPIPLPLRSLAGSAQNGREGLLIASSQLLRGEAQLGFDPVALKTVRDAGLIPTARVSNALNLNTQRLTRLMDECKSSGAHVVIFSEDEVLGYDTLQPLVAQMMHDRGLLFGNIEFSKQRGWEEFAKRTQGDVVRVHSVAAEEAVKAKVPLLVDRYARAVKERNVRVVYIRLIRQFKGELDPETKQPLPNRSALDQNLEFVSQIKNSIEEAPFPSLRMGEAVGFGDYPAQQGLHLLTQFGAALGALGAAWLLLNLFFDLSVGTKTFLLILGLVVMAGLSRSDNMGTKMIGLLAGSTVVPVAILWGGLPALWEKIDDEVFPDGYGNRDVHVPFKTAFWKGTQVLMTTCAITLVGVLFLISAFNHWKYLSHTDEFLHAKTTLLMPPFLMALAFAGRVFPARVIREGPHGATLARTQAWKRLMNVLAQPFTFRIVLVAIVLAMVGNLFIARTGNDSGMDISQLEWNFRALMEKIFLTRPRTKEMFFGMPAMIFAAYFALRKQPLPALGAAVAASVGIADALDTFCHFWTPLFYSLLRTVHGIWIGALLGGAALWVWMLVERRLFGRMKPLVLAPRVKAPVASNASTAAMAEASRTWNAVPSKGTPNAPTNGTTHHEDEPSVFGTASTRASTEAPPDARR